MNVSIELTKTAHSENSGETVVQHDIDMDIALNISAALRALPNADIEATIVVENQAPSEPPTDTQVSTPDS